MLSKLSTTSARALAAPSARTVSGFANWDFSWIRNEVPKSYAPGTPDRAKLKEEIEKLYARKDEVPCIIGGEDVFTGNTDTQVMPTEHGHAICDFHIADEATIERAIDASMSPAAREWAQWPFEDRAAVFLKAADLCAGKYREELNAAIMLGTGKTPREADIDNTEISDFFRFGVKNAAEIYDLQPPSLYRAQNYWNRIEHRALEGFVLAIAPFNFCALGANLAGIPALMGNTVVFKPSTTAVHESWIVMKIFKEAGLPDGVVNFIPCSGRALGAKALGHRDLGGVNFTGSTGTFHTIWRAVAENIDGYKSYPRIVGETGGKNFHFVHESADMQSVVNHTVRGAFDYQGQKCSATSRMYVPEGAWNAGLRDDLVKATQQLKQGCASDLSSFLTAVIDRASFDNIKGYLDEAKASPDCEVLCGGGCDDAKGFFIEPTIIETSDPKYATMCDELFGPVLTVTTYKESEYEATLKTCDATSEYALTGSIFAQCRRAVRTAEKLLQNSAGNFYVNDKCTGAAVGEQPFGGSRKSGTNDKTGTILNNLKWTSARTIKETFEPLASPLWPCNSDLP
jgi:1-pyrroline-5-carboxylate dehydrogenase